MLARNTQYDSDLLFVTNFIVTGLMTPGTAEDYGNTLIRCKTY